MIFFFASLLLFFSSLDDLIPGRDTIFSSYPGTLHSVGELIAFFAIEMLDVMLN